MPFENTEPKKSKRGLKIDNTNSTVPKPQPPPAETFKKNADAAFSRQTDYKTRTQTLALKFKALMEDRTLTDNKTVLNKDMETSVLNELVKLAAELIEDDAMQLQIGTTMLPMLLMKMMLVQRDIINKMAYKIERLEKANALVATQKQPE